MKRLHLKTIGCLLMLSAFIFGFRFEVAADTPEVITGFEELEESQKTFIINAANKPDEASLVAAMPAQLEVYLNGSSESEWIDVEWFHILNEYEESDAYYFQFSPSWDATKYVLSDEIDLYTDAPYIAVFLEDAESGIARTANNKSNETIIFEYLTEKLGYNTAVACGILANIYSESAFNSINLERRFELESGMTDQSYTEGVDLYIAGKTEEEGAYTNFVDDRAGYGLCQWTYPTRKEELLEYAIDKDTSIGDAHMQLSFLEVELKRDITLYKLLRSAPNTAQGAYDAGYQFCYRFERPSNYQTRSIERGNLAVNTYWIKYASDYNPFTDVSEDSRFYNAIMWAYENGITTGKTATTFQPLADCTRGQVVTFLWRTQGCPKPTITKNPFTDVASTSPFYKAILWAYENGITTGKTATTFQPDTVVTREQFVTFLWRCEGELKPTIKNPFTDVAANRYSTHAILWAYENGITTGKTATTFEPASTVIRQHVVTFLYRLYGPEDESDKNFHTHSYTSKVTKEAACEETGTRTYTCSCGDTYVEIIPKKGHNLKDPVEKEPATCSKKGVMLSECADCDYTTTIEIPTDPEAHTFEEVTENDVVIEKCSGCGVTKTS